MFAYARKQIRPDRRGDGSPAKLATETLLAASLSHPHIVAVHSIVEVGGRVDAVLLGYAERGALSRVIKEEPAMSTLEKLRVGLGTAHALEHMHSLLSPPVAHLDIKPDNILIEASGNPKLSDFGLSREIRGACLGAKWEPQASWPLRSLQIAAAMLPYPQMCTL